MVRKVLEENLIPIEVRESTHLGNSATLGNDAGKYRCCIFSNINKIKRRFPPFSLSCDIMKAICRQRRDMTKQIQLEETFSNCGRRRLARTPIPSNSW